MVDVEGRVIPVPRVIDRYEIDENGNVIPSFSPAVDIYISEFDVKYFKDVDIMRKIRTDYGSRVGVMRDVDYSLLPKGYRTEKTILGVV